MKLATMLKRDDETQHQEGRLFSFVAESIETAATQACGLLIGIPMLAITARWLGPDGRGIFVTATTWAGLTATICGFSLGLVAIHEMGRMKESDTGALLGTLLTAGAAETFVAWCLLMLGGQVHSGLYGSIGAAPLVLGFAGIPFLIFKDYFGSLLIGRNRVVLWNRAQLAGTVFAFLLVVVLAGGALLTVNRIVVAWLCGQILVCAISFKGIYRHISKLSFRGRLAKSLANGGFKLHINAIGSIAISSVDVLMVNSFVGAREVGYYQLALKLTTNLAIIAQAVGTVTYGRIVKFGPDRSWSLVRRICGMTMGLLVVIAALAAWFAPLIVKIVGGPSFEPSVLLFRLMLLAIPGLSIGYLMIPQWICRGYFWQAGMLTVVVAGLNALGNWILVPKYGALGAALSFIGVQVMSIVVNSAMFAFCELRWRHAGAPLLAQSSVPVSISTNVVS